MAGWMLLPICGCLGVFGLCALYAWGLARIAGEADARRAGDAGVHDVERRAWPVAQAECSAMVQCAATPDVLPGDTRRG